MRNTPNCDTQLLLRFDRIERGPAVNLRDGDYRYNGNWKATQCDFFFGPLHPPGEKDKYPQTDSAGQSTPFRSGSRCINHDKFVHTCLPR